MPAAFFDFFRKVVLKSPDGSTIETVIEADSFTDELNIVRGPGVAFNGDDESDTFEINVDYDLSIPVDTTDLTLTDINGNTSSINLVQGEDIILTRVNSNTIRIDASNVTIEITNISLANPIQVTTLVAHQLVNGAEITIQDVLGTTELNGNSYFVDVIDSNNFTLYSDEDLTTPIDGTTGFTSYSSGGTIQVQNVATLTGLLDVDIDNVQEEDAFVYRGGRWINTDTLSISSLTADLTSDSLQAISDLTITSAFGGSVSITNGFTTQISLTHDTGNISLDAGSTVEIATTDGDILVGNGSNTVSFNNGTTVDFANTTIVNAAITGSLTGNADTATALETARNIGGVSFDGTADINLPGVNAQGNQDTTGNAATATALETARDFSITGGGITATAQTFDGTGNIVLNASVDNNSIELGTKTTGNYVATITGASGQIEVTGSGTETAAITLGLPNNVVIPNDLSVNGDLNVYGSVTSIETTNTTIADNIIMLNSNVTNNVNDSGIIIERGAAGDNAIIAWDESDDKWILGTTTANDVSVGDLTITPATLVVDSIETIQSFSGNVVGDITSSGTSLFNDIEVSGNFTVDAVQGDVTGNVQGDVLGADSAILVDGTNRQFIGAADTADAFTTPVTITLDGDITGPDVVLDGATSNITFEANVVNDSHEHTVAFITDFQTGVENSFDTLITNGTQANGITFAIDKPNDALNVSLATPTLNLTNTVGAGITGSATLDLSGTINIETEFDGEIALGTNTSGSYVESLVAGTGIALANNSGESATPTISVSNIPTTELNTPYIILNDQSNTEQVDLGEQLDLIGADQIEITVSNPNILTIGHGTSGVSAATYGGTSNLVSITVDAEGHITSLSDEVFPSPTVTFDPAGQVIGSFTLANLAGTSTQLALNANLDDLIDVVVPTPSDGDILVYNGGTSRWVNTGTINNDIKGSVFSDASDLLVDGVNGELVYNPGNPSDWNGTAPTTVGEALDRLAAWITANGGAGSP